MIEFKLNISPSALERVKDCPASALLYSIFESNKGDSSASLEGKIAHAIAETIGGMSAVNKSNKNSILKHVKKYYFDNVNEDIYYKYATDEMFNNCLDYIHHCKNINSDKYNFYAVSSSLILDKFFYELEVDLTSLLDSQVKRKGIIDYVRIKSFDDNTSEVHIVDLKYGYSKVSVKDNLQLLAYAIAFYQSYKYLLTSKVTFYLSIFQPKLTHEDDHYHHTENLSLTELLEKKDKIKKIIQKARSNYLNTNAGATQCNFCTAKMNCNDFKKVFEEVNEFLKNNNIISELTNEQLVYYFSKIDLLTKFIKEVKSLIEEKYGKGQLNDLVTYKEGRRVRQIINIDYFINDAIKKFKLNEDFLYEKKLKSLKELEKVLPKEFINFHATYIYQAGKYVILNNNLNNKEI